MSSIGTGIGDIGSAVSDLFGAEGSEEAGAAYGKAAAIATQNEQLTQRSTAIQEQQAGIETYQALGTESATSSGAGFTADSGSAQYLMRSSASQAALSKQLIETQGETTALGYAQQANAYTGQQQAAQTAAKGQTAGGIGGLIGGALSIFGL